MTHNIKIDTFHKKPLSGFRFPFTRRMALLPAVALLVLALAGGAAVTLAGCGGDETDGGVSISLLFAPGQTFETLGVQSVVIFPTGPGITTTSRPSFPVASSSATIPPVPHGADRRIVVEGYSGENGTGTLMAKGTSCPFNLQPGQNHTAKVLMSKPDAFAQTIDFESLMLTKMSQGRVGHGVTSLPDGTVLVIGGATPQSANQDVYQNTMNSIAIYNPKNGRWIESETGLNEGRAFHTVTRIPGKEGYIIVAGGINVMGGVVTTLASVELIIPTDDRLEIRSSVHETSGVSSLRGSRAHHSASVLEDGSVFLTGGAEVNSNGINQYLKSAEICSIGNTGLTCTEVPDMASPRAFHQTVTIGNRVLVAGGSDNQGPLDGAEIFLTNQKTFINANPLQKARSHFALLLHRNKDIIAIGGKGREGQTPGIEWLADDGGNLVFKEILPGSDLANSCARGELNAIELLDGEILVTGGSDSVDLPTSLNTGVIISKNIITLAKENPLGTHYRTTGSMINSRRLHQSILLNNGDVLIIGGVAGTGMPIPNETEVFTQGIDPADRVVPEQPAPSDGGDNQPLPQPQPQPQPGQPPYGDDYQESPDAGTTEDGFF